MLAYLLFYLYKSSAITTANLKGFRLLKDAENDISNVCWLQPPQIADSLQLLAAYRHQLVFCSR